ncbi:MAG: DinB family protein [Phycisphaerales bacterium]|nr:DinB family protein [Phycisphaerales bacterium]
MKSLERFDRLLAYEAQANERCFDSIAGVAIDRRHEAPFAKALGIAAHVQLAREVWLGRLLGQPVPPPPDWFPPLGLDTIRAKARANDGAWKAYLATLTDDALNAHCRYTSSEGVAYRSLVDDILTHVFNHSTYHRGQIAPLVTHLGAERAGTDFIALTRERV